jgi:DNA-binding MarR family transcriptional regulator
MGRPDNASGSGDGQLDVTLAEAGLSALLETWESAIDELGCSVPAAHVRALLVVDRAESLSLRRLARALGVSAQAAGTLCDRMEATDLLTRAAGPAASRSRSEIVLFVTESGRRLARWVRIQRCAALGQVLQSMSPDGRQALAHGLSELAAGRVAGLTGARRLP